MESLDLVGGHQDSFLISSSNPQILLKATRQSELDFYEISQSLGISAFTPTYYGFEGSSIMIENLLYGTDPESTSIIDIKMGTSTVTNNCASGS